MNPATIGSFELIELLGEGGVGQVYSARDPVLGRRVAIKMLRRELSEDREFRDRFYGEAQRLGDLNHANITTLYGLHFADDKPFMVMELVRGRTLKELREAAGRLPPRESLAVLAQTLAGLAYAHRAGVIHRDIKPSNLMIADGGIVKIMDFGIARVRGSAHMTRAGQTLLTPLYASPEQIKGEEVDERSDLYSLGIVLYEMLAGRPPFTAKSEYLLERAHLEDPPPPLAEQVPGLDPAIEAAALRALAKNPGDRFASAEEFGRVVGARAIRGDAPDILQEFAAAAFREASWDETRRIGRTSGASAPLILESEDRSRPAVPPPSRSSPAGGEKADTGKSSSIGGPTGELPQPAPGNEPRTVLPEDSLRVGREDGAAARTPADEFSLKGAGISPPPDPAAATTGSKTPPVAASLPGARRRVPVPAAILGGIALVLLLGLGYAGLRSWGSVFFERPAPIAAITPPTRPKAPLPGSRTAPPGSPHATPGTLPARSSPPSPPADALSPASPHIVSIEPPKTEVPVLRTAPAPPPAAAAPVAVHKPAATPRVASVEPPPPTLPKPEKPASRAAPAPPPEAAAPAAVHKPAATPRVASVEPLKSMPPKAPSPLGPPPLPQPKPDLAKPDLAKPDLEGVVTGAMSASTIKIGARWIELYGIDDPTRKLRRHIEAVAGYLTPAQGRIACYRKAAGRYQCYSGGRDLALLALRDGIARPARDAPAAYRAVRHGGSRAESSHNR